MELRNFLIKLLVIAGVVIGLYLLYSIRDVLFLFFGALLFASTVQPAVAALNKRGVPPIASILAIYIAFLVFIIGSAVVLFPSLLSATQELIQSQSTLSWSVGAVLQRLGSLNINGTSLHVPVPSVMDIQAWITQTQADMQARLDSSLLDGFRVVSEAVILFVLAFYWLTERNRFEELGARMVSLQHREQFRSIVNDIESTLGAFVRGQLVLCATVGVLAFIALTLIGVRSALLLAVFAALAEAIPMIGPIIGAIPAILVALLQSPEQALLVALAYLVIQQFESQILIPKIMEHQVGLSPLFVLLALTAGNLLAGIPGALVAIPIAAALRILTRELVIAPTVASHEFPIVEGAVLLTDSEGAETATTAPAPAAAPATTVTVAVPAQATTPDQATTPIIVVKKGESAPILSK